MNTIIIKPVITERSLKEAAAGRYTFLVDADASKSSIKDAIQKHFTVSVVSIFTNTTKGTTRRMTRLGKREKKFALKKARVQLKEGQKIELFEEIKQ